MLNSLVNFNHFTDYIGKSLLIVKLKNVVNIRTAKIAVDKENSFFHFRKGNCKICGNGALALTL